MIRIFSINIPYFSIKPFAHHGAFGLPDTKPPAMIPQPPTTPPWLGRSIATSRLRLLEHSAFVDQQSEQESYQKHLFVHIGSSISYSDPLLEVSFIFHKKVNLLIYKCFLFQPVDVRQIQDKFPEKSDGLKELYSKGPSDAFFLVKFWADLNSPLNDETNAFYGVTAT